MKVSCVMNTYRRFTCVNRSINFYLNQDTKEKTELIIFNTDTEYPLVLSSDLINLSGKLGKNIKVINNNTDYLTNQDYTNIGSIRRDSLQHSVGEYYICWDDDDVFLPWHIRQALDGILKKNDNWAWKPHTSMFWNGNSELQFACNNMEASILINTKKLKEIGFFNHQGGGEHLNWMNYFTKENKIFIDKQAIPSYCFNWSDHGLMRGHKQSGTIDRSDNFIYHKLNTKDHATSELDACFEIKNIYQCHIKFIKENIYKLQKLGLDMQLENIIKYIDIYEETNNRNGDL